MAARADAHLLGWAFGGALHSALLLAFNAAVPSPYMDEPFHVRQAQAYCALRFDVWDDKITTFPGVYVAASAAAHAMSWLSRLGGLALDPQQLCTLGNLRAMNAVCGALVPAVCYWYLRERFQSASPGLLALNALAMAAVPSCLFFHFLFYTDTLSTLLVLLGLLAAKRNAFAWAAVPLAAAILVRQTNAVWALFALALALLHVTDAAAHSGKEQRGFVREIGVRLRALRCLGARAWSRLVPLSAIVLCFALFVVANGGVVVGDRANHVPGAHFAQLLYFCAFAACFGDPSRYSVRATGTARWLCARACTHPPRAVASLGAALALIRYGTVCHPFLLADNRHYTFYLWKDLLRRPAVRYAAALGYVPCAALVWDAIGGERWQWKLAFSACCALVLVPSPLIELRYFTVPYLVLRLHAPLLTGARELVPALGLAVIVNAATIGIFLYWPWRWPDGSEARFMW